MEFNEQISLLDFVGLIKKKTQFSKKDVYLVFDATNTGAIITRALQETNNLPLIFWVVTSQTQYQMQNACASGSVLPYGILVLPFVNREVQFASALSISRDFIEKAESSLLTDEEEMATSRKSEATVETEGVVNKTDGEEEVVVEEVEEREEHLEEELEDVEREDLEEIEVENLTETDGEGNGEEVAQVIETGGDTFNDEKDVDVGKGEIKEDIDIKITELEEDSDADARDVKNLLDELDDVIVVVTDDEEDYDNEDEDKDEFIEEQAPKKPLTMQFRKPPVVEAINLVSTSSPLRVSISLKGGSGGDSPIDFLISTKQSAVSNQDNVTTYQLPNGIHTISLPVPKGASRIFLWVNTEIEKDWQIVRGPNSDGSIPITEERRAGVEFKKPVYPSSILSYTPFSVKWPFVGTGSGTAHIEGSLHDGVAQMVTDSIVVAGEEGELEWEITGGLPTGKNRIKVVSHDGERIIEENFYIVARGVSGTTRKQKVDIQVHGRLLVVGDAIPPFIELLTQDLRDRGVRSVLINFTGWKMKSYVESVDPETPTANYLVIEARNELPMQQAGNIDNYYAVVVTGSGCQPPPARFFQVLNDLSCPKLVVSPQPDDVPSLPGWSHLSVDWTVVKGGKKSLLSKLMGGSTNPSLVQYIFSVKD